MARPKKDDSELDFFSVGPDELQEVLAGLPSTDSVINLYRVTPQGKPAYIAEFSPLDFSLEGIKNTYGGGKFKYVAKAEGVLRQGVFEIDGEPKSISQRPVYKRYVNGKLVYSKPEDAEVVQIMPETQGQKGSSDINTLMLLELRALRDTIQKAPVQSPEDIKRGFLEEMRTFKELFGGQSQQSPMQDFSRVAIDLIKQGMEVASNAENGGSPWMMILDKVLPTLQDALKVMVVQGQRLQRPGTIQISSESSPTPPLPVPQPVLTGFDAVAQELQSYLPTFLRAASMGTDPTVLVDLALPQIPTDKYPVVIEWLESTTWFADLVKMNPAIQAQAAWWSDFRLGLLEQLKEPSGDHEESEG